MGLFGKKKDKTTLDLIEDQLRFWRSRTSDMRCCDYAATRIAAIEDHLMKINETALPERIKALEDAYAEILMMGKEEQK